MKVGDLVRYLGMMDCYGVIVEADHDNKEYYIQWISDGSIEWRLEEELEVISESR